MTSKTFCGMLERFSQLGPIVEQRPLRSRWENLLAARELGTHTAAEWYAQLRAQNGMCYYCGTEPREDKPRMIMGKLRYLSKSLVSDHKIPIIRGGSDAIDNIVGACESCNRKKATMTAAEYMAYLNAR